MKHQIEKWRTIKAEECFSSKWFSVEKNKVVLPNGLQIDDYYVVKSNDSAIIVALDSNNQVLLKEEYRMPVDEILYELPAGSFEDDDTCLLETAKRELLEETGYCSEEWQELGITYDCPDRYNNRLHLFLAKDVHKQKEQSLDTSEIINYVNCNNKLDTLR